MVEPEVGQNSNAAHAPHGWVRAKSNQTLLNQQQVLLYFAGRHNYENGDWETQAMFSLWRSRYGEAAPLRRMHETFNEHCPTRGMVFAIGNQANRPKTWQLLAVIRLDEVRQGQLF